MLEQMRQKGASIFIYLIFGLLIVIFVINFAPNPGSGQGGCGGVTSAVVDVNGARANKQAYHVAYSSPTNPESGRRKVYFALDTLIRRELLAQAAEERGLRATRDQLDEEVKRGYFFIGGVRVPLGNYIFDQHEDGEQTWNVRKFKAWVQSLDVSQNAYLEEQVRGLQAAMMTELLASSAAVSREEAIEELRFDQTTIGYDVVSFSPAAHRAAMILTDADVERYLAAHEAQVKAKHKEREREFLDRKPELRLRQIFLAKAAPAAKAQLPGGAAPAAAAPPAEAAPPAAGAAPAAGAGSGQPAPATAPAAGAGSGQPAPATAPAAGAGSGQPAPAAPPPATDEATAKLTAARAQIAAGKAKFVDLARQLNVDAQLKATGGDLGWRTAESASLGEKVVSDAVKALQPGEMTPVITTDRGAYLVLAEARREKSLTYDQVKHEIAADLARDAWSQEAAKRAALAALETARTSKKPLAELFPRAARPAGGDLPPGLNGSEIPDDLRKQIEEQMRQQMQRGGRQGAIAVESADTPAAWKGAYASGSGAAGAPASAGSAAGSSGPAGSAAPASPGAAGSAAATPAAGATPPGGAGAPAPAPAAPAPVVASTDALPAFGPVPPPQVRAEGPHPRQRQLPGLDEAGVRAAFDTHAKGDLVPRVIEADGGFAVVQITAQNNAQLADLDKEADRVLARMREERGRGLVIEWLRSRCEELRAAGKIKPAAEYVAEVDDDGKPAPVVYRPCWTLQ
jgi:hypothetical protein